MKPKAFVWSALLLQLTLLALIMFLAPEQNRTMKAGFEMLAKSYPGAAPVSQDPDGLIKLINPGDWLMSAFGGFRFLTVATLLVTTLNILILIRVLMYFRSTKQASRRG